MLGKSRKACGSRVFSSCTALSFRSLQFLDLLLCPFETGDPSSIKGGLGAAENGNEKVLTLSAKAGRENRSMKTRFYRKLELDETIGEAKCPEEGLSVLYF